MNTPDLSAVDDSWGNCDGYRYRFDRFYEEIHTLILWPLNSAITHLKEEAQAEDAKLEPHLKYPTPDDEEQIFEEQQRHWQYFDGQERFLYNMALVALLSHIIHTLRTMARDSCWITPRKASYKGTGELAQLWTEFKERFGLDFVPHQEHIDYLDRLRVVRNQIVHDGGEANVLKDYGKTTINPDGSFHMYDTSFSDKYPEFVDGKEFSAMVTVSAEQLDRGIDDSIAVVRWISEQLRAIEVKFEREKR